MLQINKEGVILSKTGLGFEDEGVLNPAVIRSGDKVHLIYRAVSKGNYSSLGYCLLRGPMHIEHRMITPILFSQFDYERHGVEDPRIVLIEDTYYLTYTAYDGVNALGALAISKDLVHFEKLGIIVPQISYDEFKRLAACQASINEKYARFNNRDYLLNVPDKTILVWDKNLIFFPRRINGKLFFLHRIKPDILITQITDLSELTKGFWDNYFLHLMDHVALAPKHMHEVSYIGGGCPPIETTAGWILIYHGVHDTTKGYVYTACVALMDLEDPQKEIARLPYPLFKPELDWELRGEVNNVCFPTGAAQFDDRLYIYYGAADERIAVASVSLPALIDELMLYKSITNGN